MLVDTRATYQATEDARRKRSLEPFLSRIYTAFTLVLERRKKKKNWEKPWNKTILPRKKTNLEQNKQFRTKKKPFDHSGPEDTILGITAAVVTRYNCAMLDFTTKKNVTLGVWLAPGIVHGVRGTPLLFFCGLTGGGSTLLVVSSYCSTGAGL